MEINNKVYDANIYVNQNPNTFPTNKTKTVNEIEQTSKVNPDTKINRKISTKASVMSYHQRQIQEQMSYIQTQENKIAKMQQALEQLRSNVSQGDVKIEIKYLPKSSDENNKTQKNTLNLETVSEGTKTSEAIDILLNNIKKIKFEIERRKSKLLALENEVHIQEGKLESMMMSTGNDEVVSYLDSISIQGNIESGIFINIYV
jgi:hypothetical protein